MDNTNNVFGHLEITGVSNNTAGILEQKTTNQLNGGGSRNRLVKNKFYSREIRVRPPNSFPTDHSKAVPLLQFFFICVAVVSYAAFVLHTKTCLYNSDPLNPAFI